jgi:DNA-binding NtrC family response regulator
MIGRGPRMQDLFGLIRRLAPHVRLALISGETGTGKELVARALHTIGPRRDRRFIAVNCSAVHDTVFESELFGHVMGAFTDAKTDRVGRFELADGGTLFLDEIANIPPAQQARLLRVLEGGEFERLGSSRTQQVDVRVLAATNANIEAEIEASRFRSDLLYRLNTIHIHLPPLRERSDDIVRLAQSFLARHADRHRKPVRGFSDAALSALRHYPWPGNVRELSHVIERAVLMAPGASIVPVDLRLNATAAAAGGDRKPMTLDAVVQDAIRAALARHEGNVIAAADELGMSRSALYRRMEKFGL